ncbi:hypothetical protein LTR94_031844, partial [Friedmanniomyces endolithicus]
TDFEGWRQAARQMRMDGIDPHKARFVVAGAAGGRGLFDDLIAAPRADLLGKGEGSASARGQETAVSPRPVPLSAPLQGGFSAPAAFLDLAAQVILHRSPD